ncbi:Fic family protein [Mitsuaria sp. GD03876]|uniref:Fic family protein n=1 Tax=Mitsuaria sp. GD03876 TaxID=2975399 RepID=UPI002446D5B0|nr:Fic family protein [Mitsuaria sp. GD03876]MDH0863578.1 Fic family protein [Mitsuaria sp. GD03876]
MHPHAALARSTRAIPRFPEEERHFSQPAHARPAAPFRDELLDPEPGLEPMRAARCAFIQARARPLDQHFLAEFLVDFTWASSLLEGSSYSAVDTATLLACGERNPSKPMDEAVLALNHRRAAEHLWAHPDLTPGNVCRMHALLTDDHGLAEICDSDHFLPVEQRGKPREFQDIRLHQSAYLPPFRPGTGHATSLLERVLAVARTLHPVQAAFYLLTRVAYIQSFANGNKRTARIAANLPLLQSGLLPLSYVDVDKADYLRGMVAFYELGSTRTIEHVFLRTYATSIRTALGTGDDTSIDLTRG